MILHRLCPPKKLDSKHGVFCFKSIWLTKVLDMIKEELNMRWKKKWNKYIFSNTFTNLNGTIVDYNLNKLVHNIEVDRWGIVHGMWTFGSRQC